MKKRDSINSESSKNSDENYKERINELEETILHLQTKKQLEDITLYRMSVLEMMSEQLKTNKKLVEVLEKKLSSIAQQIYDFVKITANEKGIEVDDDKEDEEEEVENEEE